MVKLVLLRKHSYADCPDRRSLKQETHAFSRVTWFAVSRHGEIVLLLSALAALLAKAHFLQYPELKYKKYLDYRCMSLWL